jgi:ribosomal protein L37E
MDCPRGEHGEMVTETHPSKALRCLICGHEKYPGTENNVADNGYGAQHRMSKAEKSRMYPVVRNLVECGYTNKEIEESTNLGCQFIRDMARDARKELSHEHE